MKRDTLSTGEAARMCSVKPDTVLKWIRKGKIQALRTAGGHFRIRKEELQPFITVTDAAEVQVLSQEDSPKVRCWDFRVEGGKPDRRCLSCIVFRAQAQKCFVIAESGCSYEMNCVFCSTGSCDSCDYYKYATVSKRKVLVVSKNIDYEKDPDVLLNEKFEIRSATSGFEAASRMHFTLPDVIVVDQEIFETVGKEILTFVVENPRCHGISVLHGTTEAFVDDSPEVINLSSASSLLETLEQHALLDNS